MTSGALRGAFVFESVVAVDSDFNKEIGQLQRGETGEYLFFDDRGSVVASNDPALLGLPLGDERLLAGDLGVHRYDDQLVVIDEVPARRLAGGVPAGHRRVRRAPRGSAGAVGRVVCPRHHGGGLPVHDRPVPTAPGGPRRAGAAAPAQRGAAGADLDRVPRAAHPGRRRPRLPRDDARPLGGHGRRRAAQRGEPGGGQRPTAAGDDPRRARHPERRERAARPRPPAARPRGRGHARRWTPPERSPPTAPSRSRCQRAR